MRQFVLPEQWEEGPRCLIEGGQARYLARVLRLGPGDRFPGMDGRGLRHLCEVLEVGEGRLLLAVGEAESPLSGAGPLPETRAGGRPAASRPGLSPAPGKAGRAEDLPRPSAAITLAPALLKGEKMDLVIRQAAEAGVSRILPLIARHSLPRPEEGAKRLERWERIAREALQQSGSALPTLVEAPLPLAELPTRLGPARGRRLDLILHEAPLAETGLHEYLTEAPDELILCVGPEGGFAPEELEFLGASGFRPLRLPGAVLRAETAALFAVAAAEIILSERSSWNPASP